MNRLLAQKKLFVGALLVACSPAALPVGHTLQDPHAANNAEPGPDSPAPSGPAPSGPTAAEPAEQELASSLDLAREPVVTPLVERAVLPADGKQIGQAGPIALEALSASGHWVAYCQSKEKVQPPSPGANDPRQTTSVDPAVFVDLGQRTLSVTALLRADESGRYLVVLIDGVAWLIDAVKDAQWDLNALQPDLRFDGLSDHRSFAFTQNALLVLSATQDPENSTIFAVDLRNLQRDTPLSSVRLTAGDQVVYRILAEHNHAFTISLPKNSTTKYWPAQHRVEPTHRCTQQGKRFDAFARLSSFRPDPYITHSWLLLPELDAKKPPSVFEAAPGFVFGFQDGWVRRLDNGRLMLVRRKSQKQIASQRCGARILHADEATGNFVIACEEFQPLPPPLEKNPKRRPPPPKYRFELYVIRPGLVRSLGADIGRTGVDVHGPQGDRYLPIRPGASSALVDLLNSQLRVLDGDARIMASGRGGTLIRRETRLSLWHDAEHPEQSLDAPPLSSLLPVISQRGLVAIGDRVFDVRHTLTTWQLPGAPLELSRSGHALVPSSSTEGTWWTQGPLLLIPPPSVAPSAADDASSLASAP